MNCKLQFIDCSRFEASSSLNLVDNLGEWLNSNKFVNNI